MKRIRTILQQYTQNIFINSSLKIDINMNPVSRNMQIQRINFKLMSHHVKIFISIWEFQVNKCPLKQSCFNIRRISRHKCQDIRRRACTVKSIERSRCPCCRIQFQYLLFQKSKPCNNNFFNYKNCLAFWNRLVKWTPEGLSDDHVVGPVHFLVKSFL